MMCFINILNYVTLILIKTSDFRLHVYMIIFSYFKKVRENNIYMYLSPTRKCLSRIANIKRLSCYTCHNGLD